MFLTVVLFIVILCIGIFFKSPAMFSDEKSIKENLFGALIYTFGGLFYIPFALVWSIDFLLDYQINYWLVMGLLAVYSCLIKSQRK